MNESEHFFFLSEKVNIFNTLHLDFSYKRIASQCYVKKKETNIFGQQKMTVQNLGSPLYPHLGFGP